MSRLQITKVTKVDVTGFDGSKYGVKVSFNDKDNKTIEKKLKLPFKALQKAFRYVRRDCSHLAFINFRIDAANRLELHPYKSVKSMLQPPACGKKHYPAIHLVQALLDLLIEYSNSPTSSHVGLAGVFLQHIFYHL